MAQQQGPGWQTKVELAEKGQAVVQEFGNVARQLVKGSGVPEELAKTERAFAAMDPHITTTEQSLKNMNLLLAQLATSNDSTLKSLQQLPYVDKHLDIELWTSHS